MTSSPSPLLELEAAEVNELNIAGDTDSDDEDAILRRNSNRDSLDEVETFLQETDDEVDMYLNNIDDTTEEEYRKLLLNGDKSLDATQPKRECFTDAEDVLLAQGMMKYNTNWEEIQKEYLPSKTPHQIFVRQKNRSCSKAPENPIKEVRRIKNLPLTCEEKALIEEGLIIYKNDWVSICKYKVPHRDPLKLARQWRTAIGTQMSYKASQKTNEKRRIRDSQRRKSKCESSSLPTTASSRCRSTKKKLGTTYQRYRSQVVKLAPDLPPVILPPTVRIMSQSAFKKSLDEASNKVKENASHSRAGQLNERNPVRCTGETVENGDLDFQMCSLFSRDEEYETSLPDYSLDGSGSYCLLGDSSTNIRNEENLMGQDLWSDDFSSLF